MFCHILAHPSQTYTKADLCRFPLNHFLVVLFDLRFESDHQTCFFFYVFYGFAYTDVYAVFVVVEFFGVCLLFGLEPATHLSGVFPEERELVIFHNVIRFLYFSRFYIFDIVS